MSLKNVDKEILTLTGKPVGEDGAPLTNGGKPMTVGACIVNALMGDASGDGVAKANRYKLAVKLVSGGEVDLSPEDLVKIKESIGSSQYLPLVVGQVYAWTDE